MTTLLKYSGDIKKFIVTIIPCIEKYIQENLTTEITLYAQPEICDIVSTMFGDKIKLQKMDPFRFMNISQMVDIKSFFDMYYGFDYNFKLMKPFNYNKNHQIKYKKYICIYPKRREIDKVHNISMPLFDEIYDIIRKFQPEMDIYIIGNPLDTLSVKKEKCIDVNKFLDATDYLKHCKLFICSESNWVTIALLCNCRNIMIYHSSNIKIDDTYNPFNCNINSTDSLKSDTMINLIKALK